MGGALPQIPVLGSICTHKVSLEHEGVAGWSSPKATARQGICGAHLLDRALPRTSAVRALNLLTHPPRLVHPARAVRNSSQGPCGFSLLALSKAKVRGFTLLDSAMEVNTQKKIY